MHNVQQIYKFELYWHDSAIDSTVDAANLERSHKFLAFAKNRQPLKNAANSTQFASPVRLGRKWYQAAGLCETKQLEGCTSSDDVPSWILTRNYVSSKFKDGEPDDLKPSL